VSLRVVEVFQKEPVAEALHYQSPCSLSQIAISSVAELTENVDIVIHGLIDGDVPSELLGTSIRM
jgi:hypothetical protein